MIMGLFLLLRFLYKHSIIAPSWTLSRLNADSQTADLDFMGPDNRQYYHLFLQSIAVNSWPKVTISFLGFHENLRS